MDRRDTIEELKFRIDMIVLLYPYVATPEEGKTLLTDLNHLQTELRSREIQYRLCMEKMARASTRIDHDMWENRSFRIRG